MIKRSNFGVIFCFQANFLQRFWTTEKNLRPNIVPTSAHKVGKHV